jgi:prepilin-type processing-associated H-X9-DG protein
MVEMLTVIAIIGILAAILLPVLSKSEERAKRIFCIHSQQQIGLAFHAFSNDHNGKFPMAISTNDGGSLEYVDSGLNASGPFYTSFRNFQALSNELVLPQTLVCPSDTARTATNSFASLQNENLSYSVGVLSTFDKPLSILAGDRNVNGEIWPQITVVDFGRLKGNLVWGWDIHQTKGNMLYADGHVEEWNTTSFATAQSESAFNNILFLPTVVESTPPIVDGGPGSGGSGPGPGSGAPGSSGSGPSSPSYPTQPSTEQWVSSPAGKPGMGSASYSSPNGSSPGGQPAPFVPASSGERLYQTETLSQTQAPDAALATVKPGASADTDAVVSVTDPSDRMSPFDRHMTMVMQNSLLWLYILLCILVLLYLLNLLRKRNQRREEE